MVRKGKCKAVNGITVASVVKRERWADCYSQIRGVWIRQIGQGPGASGIKSPIILGHDGEIAIQDSTDGRYNHGDCKQLHQVTHPENDVRVQSVYTLLD